jgi:hypothetical protein
VVLNALRVGVQGVRESGYTEIRACTGKSSARGRFAENRIQRTSAASALREKEKQTGQVHGGSRKTIRVASTVCGLLDGLLVYAVRDRRGVVRRK